MDFVFDIAGQTCAADHVRMLGNTLEVEFEANVLGALADAFDNAHSVSVLSTPPLPVTYSVQNYRCDEHGSCLATFAVNSSEGRVLH
ncbi:MAG: hypothetical protein ABJE32_05855 [Lentilitoribacter sp.]